MYFVCNSYSSDMQRDTDMKTEFNISYNESCIVINGAVPNTVFSVVHHNA